MNLFAPIENVHVYFKENLKNIHVYLTEILVFFTYFAFFKLFSVAFDALLHASPLVGLMVTESQKH
jgi:phosphate starvation-inducible membrane PsiE